MSLSHFSLSSDMSNYLYLINAHTCMFLFFSACCSEPCYYILNHFHHQKILNIFYLTKVCITASGFVIIISYIYIYLYIFIHSHHTTLFHPFSTPAQKMFVLSQFSTIWPKKWLGSCTIFSSFQPYKYRIKILSYSLSSLSSCSLMSLSLLSPLLDCWNCHFFGHVHPKFSCCFPH